MTSDDSTLEKIKQILKQSVLQNECIKIVLSKKRAESNQLAAKINIRPINLKESVCYQKTSQVEKQALHENFSPEEVLVDISNLFGDHYLNCHVFTIEADFEFRHKKKKGMVILKRKPSLKKTIESHNKTKQYLIPDHVPCPFLIEVGIMNSEGDVKPSRYSKFRQINRYLELVSDIVPSLPKDETLRVIDFGCGKSYLTFALHYYLTEILNRKVKIVGLDWNEHVITECQKVANNLNIKDMEFLTGDIGNYRNSEVVHMAVSLHACDTATDLALAQAISWDSSVILAVPCCQHELHSQIMNSQQSPILDQGILRERYASIATDALRASLLEICGYKTQVVEFIDMEHTAKNILIRSVKNDHSVKNDQSNASQQKEATNLKNQTEIEKYRSFKKILGIESFTMEKELIKLGQLNSLTD